ncbi:MAG: hypothetical protein K2N72_03415 [Oscillospiraceae bacterium]|nr:hypothetical protein [Oscillospiraceae bacterium]
MRMCPECHRLSRDDDFCSHCGAAVYPDNTYTGSNISCDNYREFDGGRHTHEKESYSRPYAGNANRPEHRAHQAQPGGTYQSPPASERPSVEGGRKKGTGCVVLIVIFFVFFSIIDSFDIEFWKWLGDVLEEIFYDLF